MESEILTADWQFGDKFMPEVKAILGQFLLKEAELYEDRNRNTDLIALELGVKRVGVRIRRYKVYEDKQWRRQFTIRYKRDSGARTELEKILEGWGDYLFYGFADETETHLINWFIGDYNALRRFLIIQLTKEGGGVFRKYNRVITNGDGSEFVWFWREEVPDFVVAESDTWKDGSVLKYGNI